MQDIVASLPADAREEYERVQVVRKDGQSIAYAVVDPAFAAAPLLNEQFRAAGTAAAQPSKEELSPEKPTTTLAYKAAPDFSPQGQ